MTLRWVKEKRKTLKKEKITVLTKPWENWDNLQPNTPRNNAYVANLVFFFTIVAEKSSLKCNVWIFTRNDLSWCSFYVVFKGE